jgi:hypothetical protein
MLRTVEAGLMTAPARRHGWRSQGLQEPEAGRPAALPGAQQLRGVQRLRPAACSLAWCAAASRRAAPGACAQRSTAAADGTLT